MNRTRVKLAVALGLVFLVVVLVLQNTQPVETHFLMFTLTMPRAAWLAVTMLIGILIGVLISLSLIGRRPRP